MKLTPFTLSLACPELVGGSKGSRRLRHAQPERNWFKPYGIYRITRLGKCALNQA